jgi:colanic acid biosynthesis protein WcaH
VTDGPGGGSPVSVAEAVAALDASVPDPSQGLPDEVFYYVSRVTPMVNVDLLVKDERGRTLLSWRDDPYAGKGWHVPGGIIRFRETMETRIRQVAATEIGAPVSFDPLPLAINQIIHPERAIRGHFISLLFRCQLPGAFVPANRGLSRHDAGYLMWHGSCPDDLLELHGIYRSYL